MWTFESRKPPEQSPLPKEIDTWVFSRYKLNGLNYLLSLNLSGIIESSELRLSDDIKLDTVTKNKIREYIKDIHNKNPEITTLEIIKEAFSRNSGILHFSNLDRCSSIIQLFKKTYKKKNSYQK